MAETATTYSLSFTLNLVRGGETTRRSLSFDYTGELTEEAVNQVANQWLAQYNKLIQPSQWRDADVAEEEWTTIGITPSSKVTTTTTYESASSGDDSDASDGSE